MAGYLLEVFAISEQTKNTIPKFPVALIQFGLSFRSGIHFHLWLHFKNFVFKMCVFTCLQSLL